MPTTLAERSEEWELHELLKEAIKHVDLIMLNATKEAFDDVKSCPGWHVMWKLGIETAKCNNCTHSSQLYIY